MCAEAIVEGSARGKKMIGEKDLRVYLDKCVPGPAEADVPIAVHGQPVLSTFKCAINATGA